MGKASALVEGLITILVKHKVLSHDEGQTLKNGSIGTSDDDFIEFLIEEGLVDDVNVLRALGEYYQVPAFDVIGYFFDHNLLHKFPKDVLLRHSMIPLEVDENMLIMIASDPSNQNLLSIVGQYVSYDVRFDVGLARHINDAVKEYYEKAITEEPIEIDEQREHIEREKANRIAADDIDDLLE